MHALSSFADGWTLRLFAASLQGAVLAAAVWLLCRWMPSLPAAVRSRLWWLVCAQMLLGLLWPDAMKLHPLHQQAPLPVMAAASPRLPGDSRATDAAISTAVWQGTGSAPVRLASPTMSPLSRLPGWRTLLLLVWMAGTSAGLVLLVREKQLHRRHLDFSLPASADLQQLLEQQARTVGLRQAPALRIAPDIQSPQVIGLLRPTVLMPERDLSAWNRGDLVLALRHECLHLRHHDLWWGWGPVLAQRLFFFNPVAALAAREFALAREAAVDEALLRQPDVSARRYGELLLRLGVSSSGTTAMATASPSFRILHRRLSMMNALSTRGRAANAAGALALLLVAGASLPLSATPTPIPAVPAVPPVASAAPAVTLPATSASPAIPAVPAAPAAPAAPGRHVHSHSGAHNSTYVFSDDKSGTTLDIDRDDDGRETNIIVSGSGKDAQIIKITKDPSSHVSRLWYHDGNKSYVLDDSAIMAKVSSVLDSSMKSFGEQQGRLGEQQGLLSGKQAELGAEQARLGAEEARLSAQLAQSSRADDEKLAQDIERQQEALEKEQDELGKKQDEIGRQQDELGRRQDEIGRQQDEAARAAGQQIREIMKQAIDGGLARPEKG